MNFKKYKHLFNIHLFAATAVAAAFHFSIILSSLFLWEAPPYPDRQEQEFKKIEMSVSYHNTSKYLSDEELQKILDAEEEYEKSLTDADRARQREVDEINRHLYGNSNVISPPAPRNSGFPESQNKE